MVFSIFGRSGKKLNHRFEFDFIGEIRFYDHPEPVTFICSEYEKQPSPPSLSDYCGIWFSD